MNQPIPFDLDLARSYPGYWYLASPYSKYPAGIHVAFVDVCRHAAWLIRHGVRIYCPIAHTHPIATFGNIDPYDHKIWMPVDLPFMQGACGMIVDTMQLWADSYGINIEIEQFTADHKPIMYFDPEQVRP